MLDLGRQALENTSLFPKLGASRLSKNPPANAMPIYEYFCTECGKQSEISHRMSDPPARDCPVCGKPALTKQMSAAGFRLKGGGWYETDFKSGGKRNLAEGGGTSSSGDAASPAAASSGTGSATSSGASPAPAASSTPAASSSS